MKKITFVIIFLCTWIFAMAETEQSLRQYFADNISQLDPIEGIYDVEISAKCDIFRTVYYGWGEKSTRQITDEKFPLDSYFVWCIKETYRGSGTFAIYEIRGDSSSDSDIWSVSCSISAIGETGCYRICHKEDKSSQDRFVMDNLYLFVANIATTGRTLCSNPITRWSQNGVSVKDEITKVKVRLEAIKSYPTASMYANATNKKEEENETEKDSNWSGTGFALNNGYVVTNYHVIDGAKTIAVKGIKGDFSTALHADVVASDKINDLAIIKINDENFNGFGTVPYKIRASMVDVGAYVWTLGYPMTAVMGDEIKYTDGKINSKSGVQGDISVYQISIPIQPGNSGSPVFDKSGYVVGIASARLNKEIFNSENVNYAIKSNNLRMLVESSLSTSIFPNGTALQGISNTEQIKIAKNFVYIVQCSNQLSESKARSAE